MTNTRPKRLSDYIFGRRNPAKIFNASFLANSRLKSDRLLGIFYLEQHRFPEALTAYAETREQFERLQEPAMVAVSWHQTGMTYQKAGNPDAAEEAYQQAYRIKVQLGDAAGQANTLGQLGNLYGDDLSRPEQAASFYRQAAEIFQGLGDKAKEGLVMSNLANTFRKLSRYDEARQAIKQAITCKAKFGHAAEPWKTWDILADIETETGNLDAANKAKNQAIASYLAYRRDGGENHTTAGRIAHAVTEILNTEGANAATALLQEGLADPELGPFHPYLNALTAVINGSRDPGLVDAPDLHYTMAAEILLLIETLARASNSRRDPAAATIVY